MPSTPEIINFIDRQIAECDVVTQSAIKRVALAAVLYSGSPSFTEMVRTLRAAGYAVVPPDGLPVTSAAQMETV